MTVLNYLETHSHSETARHFAVFPGTTIANWLRAYRIFGYTGLKSKPKSRQPIMGRKRIHPLTLEQQEPADLKQENYQLRMDQRTEKNKRPSLHSGGLIDADWLETEHLLLSVLSSGQHVIRSQNSRLDLSNQVTTISNRIRVSSCNNAVTRPRLFGQS